MTTKTQRGPLNGVDTPTLFATIDAVRATPSLAAFQFRVTNRWVAGTHNRTTIRDFYGAGQEDTSRTEDFRYDADHPAVLVGTGKGATPVEFLLHALAACLTAGLANIAAAHGVELTEVESTVEGDIDLRGILGLSDEVRNGYQGIRVSFRIRGDAPDEVLRALVEQSRSRSAVYDVVTNGVPVQIDVSTDAADRPAEGPTAP
ncbi:OsmC family protein [Actinomadura scrupuli]|uniref:OsmC family protein n=1 Tax=Actinomadura scrupuli TaxID=559629 RepID=UPI003D96F1F1